MNKINLAISLSAALFLLVLPACTATNSTPVATGQISIPITGLDTPAVGAVQPSPRFNDVPFDFPNIMGGIAANLHDHIQAMYDAGITNGTSINPPLFSPDTIIDRAHYAVFLLRAAFGSDYEPPANPTKVFNADEWTPQPEYQQWAEGLYQSGMTSGCQADPLMFCPNQELTRLEAVTFALRLKYNIYDNQGHLGFAYTPPNASGAVFADMTDAGYYGTAWAEAAYANHLLPACGFRGDKPLFCPNETVTRAWAAYIIVEAKNLLP